MKILVVGDFHGKFPGIIKKTIKNKKIDLVVTPGDYVPFHYRKLWFEHRYHQDVELWEVIGKKKYKKLVDVDMKDTEKVIRALDNLGVPVISTLGNVDYPDPSDVSDFKTMNGYKKSKVKDIALELFLKIFNKSSLKPVDYRFV